MTLSPSSLSLFRECPRCFYLRFRRGLHRPRTPFPSLPSAIDLLVKAKADACRPELPDWLEGVEGHLFPDQSLLDRWRDFHAGLRMRIQGADVLGVLDDLLLTEDHAVPVDFKTCGSRPRAGTSAKFNSDQLSVYSLLLEENGIPTSGLGLTIHFWPTAVNASGFDFATQVCWIEADSGRAERLVQRALACLDGEVPDPGHDCGWCSYRAQSRRR